MINAIANVNNQVQLLGAEVGNRCILVSNDKAR
jgi:hypothetical protein